MIITLQYLNPYPSHFISRHLPPYPSLPRLLGTGHVGGILKIAYGTHLC